MTENNPFGSLAGGFGTPGSAPAPAQAPAPAPSFGSAPAPAQTAPVTPITEAPSLRPNIAAMNPATAGVDAFGTSRAPSAGDDGGERHRIADDEGRPVLIRIHEIYRTADKFNPGQEKDVAVVDWVVLDPTNPQIRTDARIFNPGITKDLIRTLSDNKRFHVGRVGTKATDKGKPAVILIPLTAEEAEYAKQAGQALGWF
jgi:hypothetical protein